MSRETYKRLDIGLLHGVLGHARAVQRPLGGFGTHEVVGLAGLGFGERDHAHAEDVNCGLANGDTCFL